MSTDTVMVSNSNHTHYTNRSKLTYLFLDFEKSLVLILVLKSFEKIYSISEFGFKVGEVLDLKIFEK